MFDPRFEPLRNMESFTDDMFNRIISFQEKQHPAWNEQLPFDERIKGLPLHNIIFSNPDRNPQTTGPTVAHYYPLREEMLKIAGYAKRLKALPTVCDIFPGNGFVGSLLAREGLNVIGLQNKLQRPNQIASFFDASTYKFSDLSLSQVDCDVVFAAWVPSGVNPSPEILKQQPQMIVYVYTQHEDPNTGQRQTGTQNMFEDLATEYSLIDTWITQRPKNILHDIWPDMTPSIEETRYTRIYVHNSLEMDKTKLAVAPRATYPWEKDLQMALLALEAKNEMHSRGVNL